MLWDDVCKEYLSTINEWNGAGADVIPEGDFIQSMAEVEAIERQLDRAKRQAEYTCIAMKVKRQEGYSLRNAYNDGYQDGLQKKFERKDKHPTNIKEE